MEVRIEIALVVALQKADESHEVESIMRERTGVLSMPAVDSASLSWAHKIYSGPFMHFRELEGLVADFFDRAKSNVQELSKKFSCSLLVLWSDAENPAIGFVVLSPKILRVLGELGIALEIGLSAETGNKD